MNQIRITRKKLTLEALYLLAPSVFFCHKALFFIVFGAKMFILSLLRSLALRPPAVSQSAPHFRPLLFPFSIIPFLAFSSFLFLNKSRDGERKNGVFECNLVVVQGSFSSVPSLFYRLIFGYFSPFQGCSI